MIPGSQVPHDSKQRKPRIKVAGIVVLEAFYSSHKRQPNDAEAKELLHRVQEVPGCQSFDMHRLHLWFTRKRKMQTSTSYATLTPESIQHLKVISHGQQHPTDEVISTWALLLKADVEDIKSWIMDNFHHSEEPPSPTEVTEPFQMPTPNYSTSPEPVTPGLKVESPLLQHGEVAVFNHKFIDADINKIILDVVLNTTKDLRGVSESHSPKSPCNASEFDDMFTPYEEKMERIIGLLT